MKLFDLGKDSIIVIFEGFPQSVIAMVIARDNVDI